MGYRCFLLWLMVLALSGYSFAAEINVCPSSCKCLGPYVDCCRDNVQALPDSFPSWVESLDLSTCKLKENWNCDLSNLDNLTDLQLNKNVFSSIPNIGRLKSLRKLSLHNNEIKTISPEKISSLPLLEELNLNNNFIDELHTNDFPLDSSLKILYLNNNRLKNITKDVFQNLPSLIELKINRNRLSHLFKHSFNSLKFLKILELNKNQIPKIDSFVFQGMDHLGTLRLRHNKIKAFMDAAFYGLNSITVLQLDHNSICNVSKGWMYGLDSLTTLSMSANKLSSIVPGCWEFNGKLEDLDLSNNNLEGLYGSTFEHLSNLKKLKLDNNQISTIAENAFSHTPQLEVLLLAHNRISWTVEDMNGPFARLNGLINFSLAGNHIKSISDRAFIGLGSLIKLNLNDNNITSLHEHSFKPLPSLKELHLNSSSLLCDCQLRWLWLWLKQSPQTATVKAVCAYPAALRGKPVADLNRDNFTCNDSPMPKILEHPKTQMAIKGATARLKCKAVSGGGAGMLFLWRRNNANVTNPVVVEHASSPDPKTTLITSELLIRNITNSDSGKYQCVVSNGYGTTYSQKSRITIVIFPEFKKSPSDITVRAGETAKLECAAGGEPAPQIAWQKDGGNDFPAARERRMHVMPSDDAFFIVASKIADAGIYSCTAKNSAGSVVANATLTVLEPPSFVTEMENKEIAAGESAVLQCMVSGSPRPSLRWLKDGAPIAPTERHFLTAEDQLLVVVGATPADGGLYECQIANSLGSAKGSTELRVLPPVTSTVNDDDMTGIIIITVVCCAVGTSIVWVVIIYQTRKRMNGALPRYAPDPPRHVLPPADRERIAPGIFSDDTSERSSCKDSGTGDSAKRSSLEGVVTDDFNGLHEIDSASPYGHVPAVPLDEGRCLLEQAGGAVRYFGGDASHQTITFPTDVHVGNRPDQNNPYS